MSTRLMFQMTVHELEEFYLRCAEQGAKDEASRVKILVDMAIEGYPIAISETKRSKEQIVSDLMRHYNKIIVCDENKKIDGGANV